LTGWQVRQQLERVLQLFSLLHPGSDAGGGSGGVAAAVAVAVAARGAASSDSSAMHRGGGPAAQRRVGPWRAWRCSSWSSACSCFRCSSGLQRWRRLWQSRVQAQQHALGRLLASWLERACSVRALSQVAVSIPVLMGGRSATSVLPLAVPSLCRPSLLRAPLRLSCGTF
jgi:hypothetical protein